MHCVVLGVLLWMFSIEMKQTCLHWCEIGNIQVSLRFTDWSYNLNHNNWKLAQFYLPIRVTVFNWWLFDTKRIMCCGWCFEWIFGGQTLAIISIDELEWKA